MTQLRQTSSLALVALTLGLAACADEPAGPRDVPLAAFAACTETPDYWPTAGWRSTCPTAVGVDSAALRAASARADATMPTLFGLAVARRGYVVLERYKRNSDPGTAFEMRSVTKAAMATVVGASVRAGAIDSTGQTVREYWPEIIDAEQDPRKKVITIEHLLDLSAGFDLYANGARSQDFAGFAFTRPLVSDPGLRWSYDEVLYHVLGELVEKAEGRRAIVAARERVLAPIGIAAAADRWALGPNGVPYGAGGLRLTLREMLSLGELYRRGGTWDGTPILPDAWVPEILRRPVGAEPGVIYWNRGWRQLLVDGHVTIVALGYGGQYVVIIPDLELVVVATANPYAAERDFPPVVGWVRDHLVPAIGS